MDVGELLEKAPDEVAVSKEACGSWLIEKEMWRGGHITRE
jgi:hypothetical protein